MESAASAPRTINSPFSLVAVTMPFPFTVMVAPANGSLLSLCTVPVISLGGMGGELVTTGGGGGIGLRVMTIVFSTTDQVSGWLFRHILMASSSVAFRVTTFT